MIAITLNELPATAARISVPGTGAWIADVDLDLGPDGTLPTGRAVLGIRGETLVGTIDERASGRVGSAAHVQLVGGAGGWEKPVPALHLHNDFGVTSTAVYSVTASAVGEVVVDASPTQFGPDFVRSAGPASRVLAGVPWFVDAAGITHVAAREPRPMPIDVTILEWDPCTRRAVLASEALVWPGTVLEDGRFTSATIRDVEQSFSASGARVLAWCATGDVSPEESAGTKLARALGAIARESVGAPHLRQYRYRVALQAGDGRLTLQSLARGSALPETLQSVAIWPGVAGVTQRVALGSIVLVAFIAQERPLPPLPIVVAFDPTSPEPSKVTLEADRVDVGSGATGVVMGTSSFTNWIDAVNAFALSKGTTIPPPTGFTSTKLFTE